MSKYTLSAPKRLGRPSSNPPRQTHTLSGHTPGRLEPADPAPAVTLFWGNLPAQTFTSIEAFSRWFRRQGHELEYLS